MTEFTMEPDNGGELVEAPMGEVLSGLEMTLHLAPGELVVGAIVLVKTVTAEGAVGLKEVAAGVDWLTQIGMLRQCASEAEMPGVLKVLERQMFEADEDDD